MDRGAILGLAHTCLADIKVRALLALHECRQYQCTQTVANTYLEPCSLERHVTMITGYTGMVRDEDGNRTCASRIDESARHVGDGSRRTRGRIHGCFAKSLGHGLVEILDESVEHVLDLCLGGSHGAARSVRIVGEGHAIPVADGWVDLHRCYCGCGGRGLDGDRT